MFLLQHLRWFSDGYLLWPPIASVLFLLSVILAPATSDRTVFLVLTSLRTRTYAALPDRLPARSLEKLPMQNTAFGPPTFARPSTLVGLAFNGPIRATTTGETFTGLFY